MVKKSNLLSLNDLDLVKAKYILEQYVGVKLIAHESGYHGGDYFRASESDVNIVLQNNFMEDDQETTEAEYPDAQLLLYIDGNETVVNSLSEKVIGRGFSLRRSVLY